MNRFICTNTSSISITLVSKYQMIRHYSLYSSSDCSSTTMCSLLEINVYIFIDEYTTAYWAYAHSFLSHAHLFNYFSDEFINNTMGASWAIVHCIVVEQ